MFKLVTTMSFLILINVSFSSTMDFSNKPLKQLNFLFNAYQKCSSLTTSTEFYNCLKQKAIIALESFTKHTGDISVIPDYLVLVDENKRDNHATSARDNLESFSDVKMEKKNDTLKDAETKIDGNQTWTSAEFVKDIEVNGTYNGAVNNSQKLTGDETSAKNASAVREESQEPRRERQFVYGPLSAYQDDRYGDAKSNINTGSHLNQMLRNNIYKIIRNRSLMIKLPLNYLQYLESGDDEAQAARKKKDNHSMLLGCMMMGGTLLSLAFGSLAVLSGKALMTSMLALLMSVLAAMSKKGHSGGYTAGTTYEVINVPSVTSRAFKRRRQVMTIVEPDIADITDWSSGRSDYGRLGWDSASVAM